MRNPTLLEECKALADKWDGISDAYTWRNAAASSLRDIISRHEHEDWKGPWKCEKCGCELFGNGTGHYLANGSACYGRPVPHERRKGERRKA